MIVWPPEPLTNHIITNGFRSELTVQSLTYVFIDNIDILQRYAGN